MFLVIELSEMLLLQENWILQYIWDTRHSKWIIENEISSPNQNENEKAECETKWKMREEEGKVDEMDWIAVDCRWNS